MTTLEQGEDRSAVRIMDQDAWSEFAESFAKKWEAALRAYERTAEEEGAHDAAI